MNVKEYISSGIIESYVLGIATDAERKEFEELCAQYPEIADARRAFEEALETRLLADAPAPPQGLRSRIEEAVLASDAAASEEVVEETPVRRMNPWKWVAAASLILMAGAGYWAFDTQKKYDELRLSGVKGGGADTAELVARNRALEERIRVMEADARLLTRSDMKMAAMKEGGQVYTTIFWDTASRDVYLMINNLPKPATDKQYQLWALLNGKPIDLGMIEATEERLLYRMKNVRDAQAFAITLEPRGGSAQPTTTPLAVTSL